MKSINSKVMIVVPIMLFIVSIIMESMPPGVSIEGIGSKKESSYAEFQKSLADGGIESVSLPNIGIYMWYKEKNVDVWKECEAPEYDEFQRDLLAKEVKIHKTPEFMSSFSSFTLALSIFLIALQIAVNVQGKMGMDEQKKRNHGNKDVTFQDVAGLHEVKSDLVRIVDFVKDPKKYQSAGARLPKGILLYGPPGTGKTLLAKAIAGEAGVEFISASASEFEERYVGVGAQRIRSLFAKAERKKPCILFIDEIDALGSRDEDCKNTRQSINQFLSEMDGFDESSGILVIAATNRMEDLDEALKRPGRFDMHFAVPLPASHTERMEVIEICKGDKKFDESVNLHMFAKQMIGQSPAAIETVLNEAAMLAAMDNGIISSSNLDDAYFKHVMHGHKKNEKLKQEELLVTAIHESGHAYAGMFLQQDVVKVTIVPSTSGAGGATFFHQDKMGMLSKEDLENRVIALYAGRAAEEVMFGDKGITTGASNDIAEASKIICTMVEEYGMSENGPFYIKDFCKEDAERHMKSISGTLYQNALQIIIQNLESVKRLADALMEKETISGTEAKEIAFSDK